MQVSTGQIFADDEVQKMESEKKKDMMPLPADVNVDTIYRLQKPTLQASQRAAALKALNRAKNKAARKARRKNRA